MGYEHRSDSQQMNDRNDPKTVGERQTPGAHWREQGKPDPHGARYLCDRRELCHGEMTDDELANAVYLNPTIDLLTAAKDRIRWLSRQLEVKR